MRFGGGARFGDGRRLGGPGGGKYVLLAGVSTGLGLATVRLQGLVPLTGAGVGEGLDSVHVDLLWNLAGNDAGQGLGVGALEILQALRGSSVGEGLGRALLVGVLTSSGTALGEGTGEAMLSGTFPISGAGAGLGEGDVRLQLLSALAGTSLGEGLGEGVLELARILAEDALFYLDTTGGVVPTLGGLPVFARASSASTEDPAGRPIVALPNTPRFPWVAVDGRRRPVLKMERAKVVGDVVQAVDKLHYLDAPTPQPLGIYVRLVADFDPAGSGHVLWLSDLTNAAPHLRIRYSAGSWLVQVHNGAASAELSVPMAAVQGDDVELVVIISDDAIEAIAATGGVTGANDSVAMPLGGLPDAWSGAYLVLNGHDQAPTDARYAAVRVVEGDAFSRSGTGRLEEIRDFELDHTGALLP